MPCFPTSVFPLQNSKSDVLHLMAPIIPYSCLTLFAAQNRVSVFRKATLFVLYSQNPEIALSSSKAAEFYCDNLKSY